MNNKYFANIPNNPIYTGNNSDINNQFINNNSLSFIQLLELNMKSKVNIYQSYHNDQIKFSGIIEQLGNDYIILSNPSNDNWYLLPIMYIDYIEFEEKIKTN